MYCNSLLKNVFIICSAVLVASSGISAKTSKSLISQNIQKLFDKNIKDLSEEFPDRFEKDIGTDLIKTLSTIKIPEEDMADEETAKKLEDEDPESYYYGYDGTPDYKKARLVAYSKFRKEFDISDPCSLISPASVLMMVYTNGQGVKRNFDLGMMFGCISSFAYMELEGAINTIQKFKSTNWIGNNFSLSNIATSGLMCGYISIVKVKKKDGQLRQKFKHMTKNWSKAETEDFEKLQKAANDYFEQKSNHETCRGGTLATSRAFTAKLIMEENFETVLMRPIHKHKIYSLGDFQKSDKKLKSTYESLLKKLHDEKGFTDGVEKTDVVKTQKTWKKYKEAFVDFIKIKYPKFSISTIKKVLTDIRIKDLEAIKD